MPTSLSKNHRKLLEKATAAARVLAESACLAALENLAVHEKAVRSHMSEEQKRLRNSLRARGRALGDKRDERSGIQDILHLTELAAYEHWHRLLFTRFLTENHLLITDEANGSVPVTLEECEELAPELGARDGLDLACRFASRTLPGVFRRDDPVLDLPIALNDQVGLRKLLAALPSECFLADDALGWTYQFWQAQRKDEVNDSGKKIGADELAPVTQLFTEDYMVEFLLHNTLGAWWAGKTGPMKAATEQEARAHAALSAKDGVPAISWTYLRFVQDKASKTWRPAAGTFDAWPKSARLIRLLDPCMGSGHFLVFALPLLVRLRMEEEKLSAQEAVVAVTSDNIHGLELDERCTQIAAFNVALTAWKLAGYQALPKVHLACSGIAPRTTEAEWVALAGDNSRARNGMARLHGLFKDAPVLGSLINPRAVSGDLIEAEFHELQPLLDKAMTQEARDDPVHEMAVIARGLVKAVEILVGQFTLVATNFPFLGLERQSSELGDHLKDHFDISKRELATCFLVRSIDWCKSSAGTCAAVMPGEWTYARPHRHFRKWLLDICDLKMLCMLGNDAFATPLRVKPVLAVAGWVGRMSHSALIDVRNEPFEKKAIGCAVRAITLVNQATWKDVPDARLISDEDFATAAERLSDYADSKLGVGVGDGTHFEKVFWELATIDSDWAPLLGPSPENREYYGRHSVILWQHEKGEIFKLAQSVKHLNHAAQNWQRGRPFWGRRGLLLSQMGGFTIYTGEIFDGSCLVIMPNDEATLLALAAYALSGELKEAIGKYEDVFRIASPQSVLSAPFDLAHWQKVAADKYPKGLPKPHSDDPTQWLFNGHPKGSEQPLHVAVARLLGYRWPRQAGSSFPDCPALGRDGLESIADEDGIVCLPALNREQPAAARLRQILTAALSTFDERALVAAAGLKGSKSKTLEDWLRDDFFEQHAKLFHDRPFIWHLWDGRPDGFHALVNYHKLDHATLQKLTYSYLGDWIRQQDEDTKADKPGAAARLGAARALQAKLAAILEGEAPLDIFVRWKPLKEQAQGWHPDLNDGVRQNIRPFILAGDVGKRGAGLFRTVPLALKDKDRGTEPNRPKKDYSWFWCEREPGTDPTGGKEFVGNRWNNVHLTLARKQQAKA